MLILAPLDRRQVKRWSLGLLKQHRVSVSALCFLMLFTQEIIGIEKSDFLSFLFKEDARAVSLSLEIIVHKYLYMLNKFGFYINLLIFTEFLT